MNINIEIENVKTKEDLFRFLEMLANNRKNNDKVWTYDYAGKYQYFTAPVSGTYEIDLYCWLCYRLNSIKHPTNIPWEQLFIQFSDPLAEEMLITKNSNMIQLKKQTIPSYKSSMELQKSFRNFKTHFQVKLKSIKNIFGEELSYTSNKNCLILFPSKNSQ